jgi:hypothetical protein
MAKRKNDKLLHEISGIEMEAWLINVRRQGMSIPSIQYLINKDNTDVQLALVKAKEVETLCRSFESCDMVEFIIESDLCKVADKDEYFIYNPSTKQRMIMKTSSLSLLFNPDFLYKKAKHLYDSYNPRTTEVYLKVSGQTRFNIYCPPEWYAQHFYNKQPLQPCPMPDIYVEFFNHLVDGDQDSYNYLLKWLANSLKNRNYCYLVTVGKKGVGKGLLYQITELLHGPDNSTWTSGDAFFSTDFNDDLENNTLYYIDEISKLSVKELDRLKQLVNPKLRINGKNAKFKYIDNYINTLVSSNDVAALPVTKDERRFSIISVTDTPTLEKWPDNHDEKVKELLHPDNIAKLGTYLLTQVQYTHTEMLKYFQSKSKMREIESLSLQDWEDYFLFEYCKQKAGETIAISTIIHDVKNGFDNRSIRLSLRVFMELKEKFPGFYVKRVTKREDGSDGPIGLGFAPLDKQPKREQFNLEVLDTEE